jgi:nucleoside-diphosphate-sugar epimerase
VTTVVSRARTGMVACDSEAELAAVVSAGPWDAVIDLRASDAPSTGTATRALRPSSTYILVSSIYAYCHPRTNCERSLRGLIEGSDLTPTGPYGTGKVAAENAALSSDLDDVYVVRLPFVFGVGDRTGRTDGFWRAASAPPDRDRLACEIGLVPAAAVAERLLLLADQRCPGRRILNADGGRNWPLRDHLAAAHRAFSDRDPGPAPADVPFDVARDFSLDSGSLHRLLGLAIDDDLERQWDDVARAS